MTSKAGAEEAGTLVSEIPFTPTLIPQTYSLRHGVTTVIPLSAIINHHLASFLKLVLHVDHYPLVIQGSGSSQAILRPQSLVLRIDFEGKPILVYGVVAQVISRVKGVDYQNMARSLAFQGAILVG